MAGQLIDCPSCKQSLEIPFASTPQQGTGALLPQLRMVPPPPLTPSASGGQQPVRRHGVFYYVFWGTISFILTLIILSFSLSLFYGFGTVFFTAMATKKANKTENNTVREKETTPVVQYLPLLTEEEKREAQTAINISEKDVDDFKGITWYTPRVANGYETAVYLYVGKKEGGKPLLRLVIRYYGDEWLLIDRYYIKADHTDVITLQPKDKIERDVGKSSGSVWETLDESAVINAHVINRILASQTTKIRMEGTKGIKDIQLGFSDIQRMRDVLLVYRYLGGEWPAE